GRLAAATLGRAAVCTGRARALALGRRTRRRAAIRTPGCTLGHCLGGFRRGPRAAARRRRGHRLATLALVGGRSNVGRDASGRRGLVRCPPLHEPRRACPGRLRGSTRRATARRPLSAAGPRCRAPFVTAERERTRAAAWWRSPARCTGPLAGAACKDGTVRCRGDRRRLPPSKQRR